MVAARCARAGVTEVGARCSRKAHAPLWLQACWVPGHCCCCCVLAVMQCHGACLLGLCAGASNLSALRKDSSCTAQLQLHTQALLVSRHSPLPRAADQVTLRCVLISSCSCTPCHENQLLRLSLLVLLLLGSRYQAVAAFAAAAVAQARTCAAAQALDHPAAHPR